MQNKRGKRSEIRTRTILGAIILITFVIASSVFIISMTGGQEKTPSEQEIISQRTQNAKVFELPEAGKYRVEAQIGAIHYKENPGDENELWKDIDTTIVDGKVTKAPYIAEFNLSSPKFKINHRKGGYLIEETVGEDGNPIKVEGVLEGNKITYFNVFEGVDIEIIALNYGVKQNLIVWNEKALKSVFKVKLDSDKTGVILDSKQMKFGRLIEQVRVWDAKDKEASFEREYEDGKIKIKVDVGELVFPVIIDPTVMPEEQIGQSSDDAKESDWTNEVNINSTSIIISTVDSYYAEYSGFRFQSVPIPQGATIDSASISVYSTLDPHDDPDCNIHCENIDDSPTFEAVNDSISNRNWTTNYVNWDADALGQGWKTSPDISSPVQEVINRTGWSSGNNLSILIEAVGLDENLAVRTWDYTGNTYGMRFDCTYTFLPPAINITSPQNTSYTTTSIDLNWTYNETLDWCAYSLNGAANDTGICPTKWWSNTSIVSGLGDIGEYSTPAVFNMSGTWYLISGEDDGVFYGFNWTGSAWQADWNIVSGLGDVGMKSAPAVFNIGGTWYLISGEWNGVFYGFNWTGSAWQNDSNIVSGLLDVGVYSTPEVFNMSGTLYLISGDGEGFFYGYNWTGSAWQSDSHIASGLDIGGRSDSHPKVFDKDGTFYSIVGEYGGNFYGFNWTGSAWQSDSNIVSGLGDVGNHAAPEVFNMSGTLYLIAGEFHGVFNGYNWALKGINTTITAQQGGNSVTIWGNDSAGNMGSATVYFSVDSIAPTINITSPLNTTYNTTSIDLNWTYNETLDWCAYSLNGGANNTSICLTRWWSNTIIDSGLGGVGIESQLTVFNMGGTLYSIAGDWDGVFYGFNWTGSAWQSDSHITSGLGDVGQGSGPEVFNMTGTLYLIAGEWDGVFNGYNWTGSAWQNDSHIVSGLGDVGDYSTPTVFNMTGTWYMIAGEWNGVFNGYKWNGTAWNSNSSIVSGLGDVGDRSVPEVFNMSGTWYLIAGEYDGVFNGYNWTGSAWQNDSKIVSGLVSPAGEIKSAPEVFEKDSTFYLITGSYYGSFDGYDWAFGTTNTTITAQQGGNNITIWANDTAGNMGQSSYVYFSVDSIYPTININLPENTTYMTNESLALNYSVYDINLDSCWYNIDSGSNTTLPGCTNTTFNVSGAGTYNLTLYANDTFGNENSSSVIFSVDLNPTSTLISPANASWSNGSTTFVCNGSDGTALSGITLYIWNSTSIYSTNSTGTSGTSAQASWNYTLPEDNYTWNCLVNDTQSNEDWDINRTLYVDTTYPIINITSPQNTTYTTTASIDLNWSVSEAVKGAWYDLNNEGKKSLVSFTAYIITTSANVPVSVYAIDLDSDGDVDVLSASRVDYKIAWYENNGSESFTGHDINTSANDAWSVYAIDLDSDGDVDVLSASGGDNKIAWYENDGYQNFTGHIINTSADGAYSVYAIDLDSDGDIDVLSASSVDDKIAWYENDGSESFTAHVINTSADAARSVYAIDLDSDGDVDVLSASANDNKIAWYENNGSESFTGHVINASASAAYSVYAIDLDSDGDVDMLSASWGDNKIAWYENDGYQNFTARVINTSASNARSVYAIDLDSDGDVDVLSASYSDNKIAWYENDGYQNFTAHVINTLAWGAMSVYAIDLDSDGDIDVLSASSHYMYEPEHKIAWYEAKQANTTLTAAQGSNNITVYAKDMAGNMNSTSVLFYVDTFSPSITNMTISPSAAADVDPNVNISVMVNVTDATAGVDAVLLQYRNYSVSTFANVTMSSIGGDLFNASFTPDVNGTWHYQVWANDTVGNSINNTPNSTDVQYECTWNMSYDIQNASGVLDSSNPIGNITINNTGDVEYYNNNCTIQFEIDEVEMARVGLKFRGIGYSEEASIYPRLYAEGVLGDASGIVNVTAYFASEEKENENFIIKITDKWGRSDTNQRNITGYIDSLPGGPYLKLHIDALASINQSSSANLTAYVRNIGNETANNVTFNWTLPSGFTNSSGALENNLTSLANKTAAPDNIQYYNLTISTDHTATYGTNYIYVNASCAGSAAGCSNRSYNIAVKVLCNPDSECGSGCTYDSTGLADNHDPGCYVAPTTITTPGGGGGGAPAVAEIVSEATYELIRGKDEKFSLEVKNPFEDATLRDVKMKVAGFLSQYISIEPPTLDNIPPNSSFNFTIHIVAPAYFVVGRHNLTFTIDSAKEVGVTKTARVEKRYITLIIHELSKEDAAQLIALSKDYIEKMRVLELNTKGVRSLLEQSQEALEKSNYEKVKELCAEIETIAKAALESHDIIIEMEKKIENAEKSGVKVEGTRRMIGLAKAASDRGDFALALERAKDAEVTYALETKGEFNLIYFIAQNTLEVFFGTLVALALLITLFFRVKLSIINNSLAGLKEEQDILLGLMKTVQHECFVEKKLSMREYFQSIMQYEDKLGKAIQKSVALESAKANIFKFKKARLELEKKRILELMKETQHQYIKEEKLDTRVYERRMHSYSTRLTEIEEELATREAERALRRDKLRRFLQFVAFIKTLKAIKQRRAKPLVEKRKKKALIEKLKRGKEKAQREELLKKLNLKKAEELKKKEAIEKARREGLERRFLAIAAREEERQKRLAGKKKKESLKQLRLQEKLRLKSLGKEKKKEAIERAKREKLEKRFLTIAEREERRKKKFEKRQKATS